ncbi:MAG: YbaB/EbfC family nucleoid-associated protein [bacterium]
MDVFKMMKQAQQIRSKAKEIEKNLSGQQVEAEVKGVKVTANAKQEILDIKINPALLTQGNSAVEKNVLAAVQEALKKGRDIMAQETKKMMGDVNMGDLGNMLK